MQDNYSRIIFLGTTGVGKTSIIMKIVDNAFDTYRENTIMVDFKKYEYEYDSKKIKLALWDTAGQETYRSITTQYLRGSKFFVLVCAINEPNSLKELDYFIKLIQQKGDSDNHIFLLCNKVDLDESEHKITPDNLETYKAENSIYESQFVSAQTGEGLNDLLDMIAKLIIGENDNFLNPDPNVIDLKDGDGKKKCC